MHSRVALLMLVVMLVSGCAALGRTSPPAVNFTGVWRMDHEMSGNPAALPGIAGSGKSADPPDGKAGDPPDGKLLAELQSQQLRIDQTGSKTIITYGNGATQTFDWSVRGRGPVQSGWKANHFVIRRIGPDGRELVRRYILSDQGDSLTVVTVFNKTALTQFYELDKDATKKAFGKLASEVSKDS